MERCIILCCFVTQAVFAMQEFQRLNRETVYEAAVEYLNTHTTKQEREKMGKEFDRRVEDRNNEDADVVFRSIVLDFFSDHKAEFKPDTPEPDSKTFIKASFYIVLGHRRGYDFPSQVEEKISDPDFARKARDFVAYLTEKKTTRKE